MIDFTHPDTAAALSSCPGEAGPAAEQSSVEVAVLDRHGVIVSVNRAWWDFGRASGADPARTGVGMSYLEACAGADDPAARKVGRAIQIAVRGDLPAPLTVRIRCDAPDQPRLFDVLVSSRLGDDGRCLGATVTLSPVEPVRNGSPAGEDRERLAADVNDQVIRELFGIGLGLQGMLDRLTADHQRERVEGYIQALDAAIARLRAILFPGPVGGGGPDGLRQRLLRVLDEQRAFRRLEVKIDFAGPLEALAGLDDDVVAFVRAAVAGVVAHPEATNAQVRVSYDPPMLTAEVTGDAPRVLPPEPADRWRELSLRAEGLGGRLEVVGSPGGQGLRWTALAPQPGGVPQS